MGEKKAQRMQKGCEVTITLTVKRVRHMSIKVSIKSLQERIWTLDEKWQGWEGGRCLVSREFQTDEILYIRIQGESPDQGSVVTRWAGWESGREAHGGGDICMHIAD